jgi:hypothetical protein
VTGTQRIYLWLADATLIVHFAYVAFVVGGLVAVWLGKWFGWDWVRQRWFRLGHLLVIGVVAGEAVSGVVCPLTTLEDHWRMLAGGSERYQGSFIQHWLHQVMFFEADPAVFTGAYVIFFGLVALSWWLVPPRWPKRERADSAR